MRFSSKVFCAGAIATTVFLSSCSGTVQSSPLYLAVTIAPRPAGVAAGGSVMLVGLPSNSQGVPVWSLLYGDDTASVGTLTPVAGVANSVMYTAPPTPPIYFPPAPANIAQGVVTIQATLAPPAGSGLTTAVDLISVFITTPTVSISSVTPATATVALNGTTTFSGYELGSVNNKLTWEVNGVVGGSASTGTIDIQGVYTAPAAMPMTGKTVTITMISQADPSKSATAVITLM
jgi:hypothetical protein